MFCSDFWGSFISVLYFKGFEYMFFDTNGFPLRKFAGTTPAATGAAAKQGAVVQGADCQGVGGERQT